MDTHLTGTFAWSVAAQVPPSSKGALAIAHNQIEHMPHYMAAWIPLSSILSLSMLRSLCQHRCRFHSSASPVYGNSSPVRGGVLPHRQQERFAVGPLSLQGLITRANTWTLCSSGTPGLIPLLLLPQNHTPEVLQGYPTDPWRIAATFNTYKRR